MTDDERRQLVDAIYATSYDDGGWADLAGALRSHFGVEQVTVAYLNFAAGRQSALHDDVAPPFRELFHASGTLNSLLPAMRAARTGEVMVDQAVVPTPEFERSAFFDLWLRPQGIHSMMAIKMLDDGPLGGFLGLTRGGSNGKFSLDDRALLQSISPALVGVAALRNRIGRIHFHRDSAIQDAAGVAFLVVDARGALLGANESGEQILEEGTLLRRVGSRVCTTMSRNELPFIAAIGAAARTDSPSASGTHIVVSDEMTSVPVTEISVYPVPDPGNYGFPAGRGAAIFVQRLAPRVGSEFVTNARRVFDLTAREAELARELALGRTLGQYVARAHISMPTARTHLSQIFRKTGTTQQSQLVALLLSALPPIPYD